MTKINWQEIANGAVTTATDFIQSKGASAKANGISNLATANAMQASIDLAKSNQEFKQKQAEQKQKQNEKFIEYGFYMFVIVVIIFGMVKIKKISIL